MVDKSTDYIVRNCQTVWAKHIANALNIAEVCSITGYAKKDDNMDKNKEHLIEMLKISIDKKFNLNINNLFKMFESKTLNIVYT